MVAGFVGVSEGALLNSMQANAATKPTTNTTSGQSSQTAPPPNGPVDPTQGGHVGSNGVKEVLLTGDTAEKVKAAALATNPGGTIQRVETDAEGSPYEAHLTKSDGTLETVKIDSNFNVTTTETGPPAPPKQ